MIEISRESLKKNRSVLIKVNFRKIFYGVGIDNNYGNTLDEIIESINRTKKNSEILVFYSYVIKENPDHDEQYVIDFDRLKLMERLENSVVEGIY